MNIQEVVRTKGRQYCSGCHSCAHRCPKDCITMQEDDEGFLYSHVDESACIDCGLCVKVCHEQHPYEARRPLQVFAAINKDEATRLASSSGGLFFLLAEKTIAEGGVVFGARFDDDWQVCITYAETLEGVKPFMGSKYVQARTGNSYKDAEQFLKAGRKVLYSGTPCQVAGLKHYLRKEYGNLTTVDFVCHGVPSPKVWSKYLDEVVTVAKRISSIEFRNKRNGWKRFNFAMTYDEREETVSLTSNHNDNHYMRAFLADLILRPSCHDCQAKSGRSHSDITVADFWGIENVHPDLDDDKGTGLVLVNTEKGKAALDWTRVQSKASTYEQALRYNPAIARSATPNVKRAEFFAQLDAAESVTNLIIHTLRPSIKQRVRHIPHRCKSLIKKLLKIIGGGKTAQALPSRGYDITHYEVSSVTFRDKQRGWKGYQLSIKLQAHSNKT